MIGGSVVFSRVQILILHLQKKEGKKPTIIAFVEKELDFFFRHFLFPDLLQTSANFTCELNKLSAKWISFTMFQLQENF